jgi:hypothetical protein
VMYLCAKSIDVASILDLIFDLGIAPTVCSFYLLQCWQR